MENNKQQKAEVLINELLQLYQGEPLWKFKWLIQFLEKAITENSTIDNNIGNVWKDYSPEDFIFFSNSFTKD